MEFFFVDEGQLGLANGLDPILTGDLLTAGDTDGSGQRAGRRLLRIPPLGHVLVTTSPTDMNSTFFGKAH